MRTKLVPVAALCCCLAFTISLGAQPQLGHRDQTERRNFELSRYTCTLFADSVSVWLWVDEEPEEDASGPWLVFAGKLVRGAKRTIFSGTDRIRYSYKTSENDEMRGDIGASCYKGNTIRVP